MEDFPVIIDENKPGVFRFWYAPVSYFYEIGDPVDHIINSIIFNPGKDWFTGWSLPDEQDPDENPSITEHGNLYKNLFKGTMPKDTPEIVDLFTEIKADRHLLIYEDNNNYKKLMGTLDAPCRFDFKLNKSFLDNRYEFLFRSVSSKPLFFISTLRT